MLETMGVEELAALLHKTPGTINYDLSAAPWRLPPRMAIPGSNRRIWLRATVHKWLEQHQGTEHQPF